MYCIVLCSCVIINFYHSVATPTLFHVRTQSTMAGKTSEEWKATLTPLLVGINRLMTGDSNTTHFLDQLLL